ncbi:hypothetical protein WA026_009427 [Henosepilachna vigintioctopunctata]|uniref:U1-type domain-containing protein n=1 Tax=Henosepilachna vigintioctopunctata TaxID=420089 RepID=A0AAW1TYA1_9CUCU
MEKNHSDNCCDICDVKFTGSKSRDAHYNGKKHLQRAKLHQDIHCGVFVTAFNASQSNGVAQYFSKFGKIIKTYLGPKSNYLIIVFEKKASAEAVLNTKHFFEGNMLVVEKRNQPTKLKMAPVEESSDANSFEILKRLQGIPNVNDQLEMFLQVMTPDFDQVVPNYHKVNTDLLDAMKSKFGSCEVYPFGSTTTRLQFNNSDIDIYVNIRNRPKEDEDCLKQAKKALYSSNLFRNIICIPSARVPIIKCVHIETEIKCDVNFINMLGVRNSQLIHYYLSLDSRLRSIMLVIKYWAKVHGLAGGNQMFTNYSLVLMFLFYLQQSYSFPSVFSLQQNTSPSDQQFIWNANIVITENQSSSVEFVNATPLTILKGFFKFYLDFPYATHIICPYLGKSVDKKLFEQLSTIPQEFIVYKMNIETIEPLKCHMPVCLQDPFVHNFNTCGTVFSKTLQKYVILCEFALKNILSENNEVNMLYLLFTEQPDEKLSHIPQPNPNNYIVRIRMNKYSNHLRKKVMLPENNPDYKRELLKLWFEEVHNYVQTLFKKVYKFNIVEVDNSDRNNSKNSRLDNQSDVYDFTDCKKYIVTSFLNLWDSRNMNTSPIDDELAKCKTTLERNIVVSEYLWQKSINIRPSSPLFVCQVNFMCLEEPAMVNIELIRINSYKRVYKAFCKYLLYRLPKDFEQNEIELSL